MNIIKRFRSRSPKHRAPAAPPKLPVVGEAKTISAWGLTEDQWQQLTDFERAECRRNIVTAPRFVP